MTPSSPQQPFGQGSDLSPRVNPNGKVKKLINENTNMIKASLFFDKSQDTEEETEDEDSYSFEQEIQVPSSLLDPKDNEYHAYSDNTSYHPTSVEGLKEDPSVHFHNMNDTDSVSAEEALYTASVFSKRTKNTIPHALAPPSHTLKARRFSKSMGDELSSMEMKRKRSIVTECQKELGNHSAVSPRFMTLRKLSEVTALPTSQGLSSTNNQDVPPVPRLPSSHLTPCSSPPASIISLPVNPKEQENTDGLLSGIDGIIEAQLQYHLGQMAWRISESHVEARKFWEEQKNQVFGFASLMVDRIEREMQRKLETVIDTKADAIDLKQELAWHQQQLAEKQCQLHELEILRIRNSELEKQHEIDVAIIKSQQMDKEKLERRLVKYEDKEEDRLVQQLKVQLAHVEQDNKKLIGQLSESQSKLEAKDGEVQRIRLAVKRRSESPQESLDHTEIITWAEIMDSEDEAKKTADLWARKYREIEKLHKDLATKLGKEKSDRSREAAEREQERVQFKETEGALRTQLDALQTELKKTHSIKHCVCCKYQKATKRSSAHTQSFIAPNGYLTFTAEINGQLSKYSVKIPKDQNQASPQRASLNPNAPSWRKT